MVSGSQDCTIKVWDLPEGIVDGGSDLHELTARLTEKAHDKVVEILPLDPFCIVMPSEPHTSLPNSSGSHSYSHTFTRIYIYGH